MDLVRSWLGQALRATGAAVVVPVAILVALSLSALGGSGLGGLGALSQIVSGPAVAGSGVAVDDGDSEIAEAVTQLAASDRASGDGPAPGDAGPGPGPGTPNAPGDPTPPGGPSPPPGDDDPGPGDPPGPDPPRGPNPGPPSPPPPPPPPPPEPPGVVQGLGDRVRDVTSGTPVAPTVEDAVDALDETCGRLGCP